MATFSEAPSSFSKRQRIQEAHSQDYEVQEVKQSAPVKAEQGKFDVILFTVFISKFWICHNWLRYLRFFCELGMNSIIEVHTAS